jgi:DNA/RNA endonuclease YhcR with UshA esterase domain
MVRVVIWRNIYDQIKNPARFKSGDEVEIMGRVKSFRGSLEVHLIGPTGIQLASEAGKTIETLPAAVATSPTAAKPSEPQSLAAVAVKIGDINQTFLNKKVTVEGSVTAYRESTFERVPTTITLTDEGKSIPVVFWQEVSSKLTPEQKPETGQKLKVVGRVIQHNDTLQIKVYEVGDIHVVAK